MQFQSAMPSKFALWNLYIPKGIRECLKDEFLLFFHFGDISVSNVFDSIAQLDTDDFRDLFFVQLFRSEERYQFLNRLDIFVPPLQFEEEVSGLFVKTILLDLGGITDCDRVGRYVFGHDRVGPDDRAVANVDAREDRRVLADPNVVADHGVSTEPPGSEGPGKTFEFVDDLKGIGGIAIEHMVRPVHHELHAAGNAAEFADDQFVTHEVVVMGDVFLKGFRSLVHILVIGIVPDDDVGVGDYAVDIAERFELRIRVNGFDFLRHVLIKYEKRYRVESIPWFV